ncbi:MAG: glycosyltransferase [Planctomycetota bacterium]
MSNRPMLSVAMIVRDEAEVLAHTIESVQPIADEVVVLDTGSYDDSPDLARRLGARVHHALWSDCFAAARNRCLDQVRGDWVLWIDAGEEFQGDSAAELRDFVDQQAKPSEVYGVYIEQPAAEAGGYAEQVARFRLMPRREGLRFSGHIRESLLPAARGADLEIGIAPGRLLRHRRHNDPARKLAKARRDERLATIETTELGDAPARLLLAMGDALSGLGQHGDARQAYHQAIGKSERGSSEMLEAYYGWLADHDADPALAEQRVPACLAALEVFPLDTPLLLCMGNYLQQQDQLPLAERAFEAAVRFGQVDPTVWHPCELPVMASLYLHLLKRALGQDDQARKVLEDAVQAGEASPRLLRALMDLHVQRGNAFDAIAVASRLPLASKEVHGLRAAIRGACKAVEQDWTAALGHLQTAYLEGCRDPLCLRWLTITYLSNGEIEAARPLLSEWEQIEPNHPELAIYRHAVSKVSTGRTLHAAEQARGRSLRLDGAGDDCGQTTPPRSVAAAPATEPEATA